MARYETKYRISGVDEVAGIRYAFPSNRRDARVVEWARLESECAGNGTEGSNPSLSAILILKEFRRILFCFHVWICGK